MKKMKFVRLGASLYVPASRNDLAAIANRAKYPHLRSVIFCTEDSLKEKDVPAALDNLAETLHGLESDDRLLRFVRVRNPKVLGRCLQMDGIYKIDGFVLPKITRHNIDLYWTQFNESDRFEVMLTLETADFFDMSEMMLFRDLILHESYHRRILSLRIGGNDLLNYLRLRRLAANTIYSTPLRTTISMMATGFIPAGFNLTGPVFESLNDATTLSREVTEDLQHGLLGKTAIHPDHVMIIEKHYQVCRQDMEMAEAIIDRNAPAVFGMHGQMCEPSTHINWARLIIERGRVFGVI
ncbi:MAG: HpcH/HpaI aldolase/citrate lyase family protein [Desulfuromonadaceae bacterium]